MAAAAASCGLSHSRLSTHEQGTARAECALDGQPALLLEFVKLFGKTFAGGQLDRRADGRPGEERTPALGLSMAHVRSHFFSEASRVFRHLNRMPSSVWASLGVGNLDENHVLEPILDFSQHA